MTFASGVYTGISNTFNNATAGTLIDPDDWNDLFTDIETAINALASGAGSFATTDVASASTANIGAAATGAVRITGTTTITSLGTTANASKLVLFAGSLVLTHNGTSLILPGAANITTQAGDVCWLYSDASGNWRCASYLTAGRTGTGVQVHAVSPALTTPDIGVATATSVNKVAITAPATSATLTIANGKTLTASNSLTLSGTDAKALVLTNGLTVTTNDGTLAFTGASKTLSVANNITLSGTDGKQLALTSGLTVGGSNDGTIAFGAASKTATFNKSLTFDGTDSTTHTFPSTNATIARTDSAQTFTGDQTFAAKVTSTGATSGIGYGTGAGGTVTQATSKSTAVTLNTMSGVITTNSATLNANTAAIFVLNNSNIGVNDQIVTTLGVATLTTSANYQVWAQITGAGAANMVIKNVTAGNLSEAPTINFAIIKGAAS